jgi:hypothetical protein
MKPYRIPFFPGATKASVLLAGAFISSIISATAAPISVGDLVIYRVGDGSAALGSTATSVFLDEYTPTGTFVQSIALPTTGATALTAVGNSTTEGIMSLSQDGNSIVFTGYRKDVGGTSPASDAPATVNRVIGTLSSLGVASTINALTDPTGTIRSATTADGSIFYIGTSTSVRYVGTPGPAATTVQIDARNSRQVVLSGNQLFASNGSTTITGKVQSYGTLPTGTTTPTPVVSLALADAVNGFVLVDLNVAVAGADTVYALSTVEGLLRKYTFDGSTWNANGSIATAAANITSTTDGTTVNIFMTTATTLFGLTDASGYGGTLSGTPVSLATAGANTVFRGVVDITPTTVPEPSVIALGIAAAGLLVIRRKRA